MKRMSFQENHGKTWSQRLNLTPFQLHDHENGPSRRNPGGPSFLNATDREKWHLKVIADRDDHKAGLRVEHK